MLIERSKQQLQTIATTVDSDNSDAMLESYVDMQPYKTSVDEQYPEPHEVYSDVSLTYEPSFRPSTTGDQLICPFINFPAAEVKNGKSGFLYRKEKILFFEQQRKIYAAIHQAWFLIYLNEHSLKPLLTFDLSRYDVRASQKDSKKRDESFELVNPTDPKMHQFTAQTSKDMYQWIAALKVQIDSLVTVRNLPTIPLPQKQKENDFVRLSNESNNDYEPLKNYIIKDTTKPTLPKEERDSPLPLPPRNATLKKSPILKTYIPKTSSSESLSSNYDSVGIGVQLPSQETSNSFSEDDSDTHYDDPSELRSHNMLPYVNQYEENKDDDDDNDIYDYLEKPSFTRQQQPLSPPPKKNQKPPKNEIKPKPVLKPKLALSLRSKKKSGM
ncbi:hypothetical protein FQR65_LT04311 [Abscondita terminalis]|nr:hypothetical protein FQR65_LT04311 [Abscondita terminalis]